MKINQGKNLLIKIIILSFSLWSLGCARPSIPPKGEEMRVSKFSKFNDEESRTTFIEGLEQQIAYLKKREGNLSFGKFSIPSADYLAALQRLENAVRTRPDVELKTLVLENFQVMEVYGDKRWGDVFVTGYFEPRIKGSYKPTKKFTRAIYRKPSDLKKVILRQFSDKFEGQDSLRARVDGEQVLPYFTREEIDSKNKLQKKKLEICWVDPIDAFFLQIQGSGVVELQGGKELYLVFSEKNGRKYEAIGRFLREKIAPEKISMQSIERYLRSLAPEEAQKIMNLNPSYVFFNTSKRRAITSIGVPATAGRTIAVDAKIYPKGALAFLSFDGSESSSVKGRFVFDQDVGGAITGPGRVDLFWGSGDVAKQGAGMMQQRANLYYFVPRK